MRHKNQSPPDYPSGYQHWEPQIQVLGGSALMQQLILQLLGALEVLT